MNNIFIRCLLFTTIIAGCGVPATDSPGDNKAEAAIQPRKKPVPAQLDKTFDTVLDDYEKKLKSFMTSLTGTTKRGRSGTTEVVFDQTAFEAAMKKSGFTKKSAASMSHYGTVNGINIQLDDLGTISGDHGGWIHQWSVGVSKEADAATTYSKERKIDL